MKLFLLMVVGTFPKHECFKGETFRANSMEEVVAILNKTNTKFNDTGYAQINENNFYQVIEVVDMPSN